MNKVICTLIIILLLIISSFAGEKSICIKEKDVWGSGKYPYNFRIIDDALYAGGTLFNPETQGNSIEKVRTYIRLLKGMGVKSIIALNASSKTEENIVKEEGLIYYSCPMNAEKVPTLKETEKIMELIENKAYVHCEWGADRTGAIVAKYLRTKKGYSGYDAWQAVITGGSHSGIIGGFKQNCGNRKLLLYFWPEVVKESYKVCEIYGI
ncbi:MAG TPA: hypothetical protein PL110_10270 [Candidatus Eremiobacteraeota bacterium]|nr:MAG: Dual specificity phosphatase, catalytic domain [bacterium ADurb.Bin363]HPZ08488.1 hypothetical protein [Candidatus Eremiobacteraeota bacterium]